jgi:hypothetical protein
LNYCEKKIGCKKGIVSEADRQLENGWFWCWEWRLLREQIKRQKLEEESRDQPYGNKERTNKGKGERTEMRFQDW